MIQLNAMRELIQIPAYLITAFLFLLVCMSWGTTWLAIKIAVESAPPMTAAGLRFVIAFPLFLLIAKFSKVSILFPKEHRRFLVFITVMYFSVPYFLINYGEMFVSSGLTALLFSSMPVFILIFSNIILKEKIFISQYLGIAIGFISLAKIIEAQGLLLSFSQLLGVLAILTAAIMHAYCYIITKKHGQKISIITYNALPIGIAGLTLTVMGFIVESPQLSQVSFRSWLALVYLGVVASVGGFIAYFYLLKRLSPVVLSFVFIIFPVFAIIIGAWYEGNVVSNTTVFFIALLLLGFSITKIPPESVIANGTKLSRVWK